MIEQDQDVYEVLTERLIEVLAGKRLPSELDKRIAEIIAGGLDDAKDRQQIPTTE